MLAETTAWFDPQSAGIIGGCMGALLGGGFGGIGGPLAGVLVPKGKAKGFVVGFFVTAVVIGVGLLITAGIALLQGQPSHVWTIFALCGFVMTAVMGGLIPVVLRGYAQAEARKLDAEQLRRA